MDLSGYNYMQLAMMACDNQPYWEPAHQLSLGGGTSWGSNHQVPYAQDYAGSEGGGNMAAWTTPGTRYYYWLNHPEIHWQYSSYDDFNSQQGHYIYIDIKGKVTEEKIVINTKEGFFEITLPTTEIVTHKIWINTSSNLNDLYHGMVVTGEMVREAIIGYLYDIADMTTNELLESVSSAGPTFWLAGPIIPFKNIGKFSKLSKGEIKMLEKAGIRYA